MPDHDTFMRMICENPADDGPRLVYADWLEEHADPPQPERAELIRVQIEQSLLPEKDVEHTTTPAEPRPGYGLLSTFKLVCGGPNCKLILGDAIHLSGCRWRETRDREKALFDANWQNWLAAPRCLGGHFRRPAGSGKVEVEWVPVGGVRTVIRLAFHRGFVDSVVIAAADWLTHGDAICAAQPVTKVDGASDFFNSWLFWESLDQSTTDAFFRGPVQSYQDDLDRIRRKLDSRMDADNRPILTTGRELAQAFLAARWPGVTFELPPDWPYGQIVTLMEEASVSGNYV